jgi:hypothetical protein
MICGRLALLMVTTYVACGVTSRASQPESNAADRGDYSVEADGRASIGLPQLARTADKAGISRFALWKKRIKGVLADSDDHVVDERDLGPAILPGHGFLLRTLEPVKSSLPTFAPLRC